MSFAIRGITHCEKCGCSLSFFENGICTMCKEVENKDKKNMKKILIKKIADWEKKRDELYRKFVLTGSSNYKLQTEGIMAEGRIIAYNELLNELEETDK